MIVSLFEMPKTYKFAALAFLLIVAAYMTYYYHHVLGSGTVFTHFFYLPIVLASIWWRRHGLWVVVILALLLLVSHYLFRSGEPYTNNLMRVLIFSLVGVVSVLLSEGITLARQRAEENRHWYETVFQNAGTPLAILGNDALIDLVNVEFENVSGFAKDEVENLKSLFDIMAEGSRRKASVNYYNTKKEKYFPKKFLELKLCHKSGEEKDIRLTFTPIPHTNKIVASLTDLTELKSAVEEQKRLKTKLAETLTKVLSGYLPICARCKKIRDESGKWVPLENYIHAHTEADFTHTVCPRCARELYPDLIDGNDIDEELIF